MRKINCDFCGKDISDDYDTVYNLVDAYEHKELDLCEECKDDYWKIRNECGDKYHELEIYYNSVIEDTMKKFYQDKLREIKEVKNGTSNNKSSKNRKR